MPPFPPALALRRFLLAAALCLFSGAALIALLYQIPSSQTIDIGGTDAPFTQGFGDALVSQAMSQPLDILAGSDGSARPLQASSFLILPQVGLPAHVTLRLRAATTSPGTLKVLLNGTELLSEITPGTAWHTYDFPITSGVYKPSDVVIELRRANADMQNPVFLDSVGLQTTGQPWLMPYPAQLVLGGLAVWLLFLAFTQKPTQNQELLPTGAPRPTSYPLASALLITGGSFLIYRLQPTLVIFPPRYLLPGVIALSLLAIVLRRSDPIYALLSRYVTWVAGLVIMGWTGVMLWLSSQHVTISAPGVEKDFRVFATRAFEWQEVFRADEFYNLGYPLLLRLIQPFTSANAFLAARPIAVLSGSIVLICAFVLARSVLADYEPMRRVMAFIAPLLLIGSTLFNEFAQSLSSDMPLAACCALAITLMSVQLRRATPQWQWLALAGAAAGAAFLMRHIGLVMLAWCLLACVLLPSVQRFGRLRAAAIVLAGGLLLMLPQIVVNLAQTGDPLYNHQAKNVWLAVYANTDWSRWEEVRNDVSLSSLLMRDPGRVTTNWLNNMRAFLGAGSELANASSAAQLGILDFPFNWLAVLGIGAWGLQSFNRSIVQSFKQEKPELVLRSVLCALRSNAQLAGLLLFVVLYVSVVCTAFVLPRFFLPLLPIYAVSAACLLRDSMGAGIAAWRKRRTSGSVVRPALLCVFVILALALCDVASVQRGLSAVVTRQPPDDVRAIALVQARTPARQRIAIRAAPGSPLAKYSVLGHRAESLPEQGDLAEWLHTQRIAYVLWDFDRGEPTALLPQLTLIDRAGSYRLYEVKHTEP